MENEKIKVEKENSKTIAKVVFIGLIVALIAGVASIVVTILSLGSNIDFIANLNLTKTMAYIIPAVVCVLYAGASLAYYMIGIEKRYTNIVA